MEKYKVLKDDEVWGVEAPNILVAMAEVLDSENIAIFDDKNNDLIDQLLTQNNNAKKTNKEA